MSLLVVIPQILGLTNMIRGNAYWVGLAGLSVPDMHLAFSDIVKSGGTTVRQVSIYLLF